VTGPDAAAEIIHIAEELRAIAANGLHYSDNHYDRDRYEQVRSLAARALALADTRGASEIERRFRGDLGFATPKASADAVIFDERDRLLLIQRNDGGEWCMPGGAADVGESPSQVAEREAREETGLEVRATGVLGVYDSRRLHGAEQPQTYNVAFACEVVGGELTTTNESLDFGWFTRADAAEVSLYRGHRVKVPQMFDIRAGIVAAPAFH
jgi:ADP-ribose pyrophosphatase YjhB (NUDIX family)